MNKSRVDWVSIAIAAALSLSALSARAATPASQLAAYEAEAGRKADPAAGAVFFAAKGAKDWSCSSCHTKDPSKEGKHASTGKAIAPMAPAFNPERFVDEAKTQKWFRRNCNDVLGRECLAAEKANFMAYLMGAK